MFPVLDDRCMVGSVLEVKAENGEIIRFVVTRTTRKLVDSIPEKLWSNVRTSKFAKRIRFRRLNGTQVGGKLRAKLALDSSVDIIVEEDEAEVYDLPLSPITPTATDIATANYELQLYRANAWKSRCEDILCIIEAYLVEANFAQIDRVLAEAKSMHEVLHASTQPTPAELEERLLWPVSDLGVDLRIVNSLENMGIMTIGDLLNVKPEQLLARDHVGQITLTKILARLHLLGFRPS